jgi:hypothetical protein
MSYQTHQNCKEDDRYAKIVTHHTVNPQQGVDHRVNNQGIPHDFSSVSLL